MRVDNPSDELRKEEREARSYTFSGDGSLDNLIFCNNDVWGGETVILTDQRYRDTVNTDTAKVENTSKRGRESSNLFSIRALGMTRKAVKANR